MDGRAVDLDVGDYNGLLAAGLPGKYGFQQVANDPGHLQMPSAAQGGILSGPSGGYESSLSDTGSKIPLPSGKSIPAQTSGSDSYVKIKMLSEELDKLDSMISIMNKQNDIATKLLRKHN